MIGRPLVSGQRAVERLTKEHKGSFWNVGNILYLDGDGYMSVYINS